MAYRATVESTPPSNTDRSSLMPWQSQFEKQPHGHGSGLGLGLAAPGPWPASPPTPQLSQASAGPSPPTSPIPPINNLPTPVHTPEQPGPREDRAARVSGNPGILSHSDGNAVRASSSRARAAAAAKAAGSSGNGQDVRMQQWLAEIPLPQTPQERHLQALDPRADHPLHPRPLQVPLDRRSRHLGDDMTDVDATAVDGEQLSSVQYRTLALGSLDKENAGFREKLDSFGTGYIVQGGPGEQMILGSTKKRQMSEDSSNGVSARKRTRMLDPVRRFSQRVSSSLALSYVPENSAPRDGRSGDLSPEDAARQSEQLYRFGPLEKNPTSSNIKNGSRLSLPKRYYGTLRAQNTGSVRRIVHAKLPAVMPPPPVPSPTFGFWSTGRPDMIVNVAFIGDAHVGKTALIRRLTHGTFPRTYAPSDMQEQTIRLTVNDVRVEFNLTEGGSARPANEPSVLALGWFSVVVLCFDVGRHSSLLNLQKYRNDISMYEESPVVILAGLKKDARRRLPPLHLNFVEEAVQVQEDEGQAAAKAMGCDKYFECSSLSSCEGVDELFEQIVHSGVEFQKARDKKMARFRFENSVDKNMAKITTGVRNLFTFRGKTTSA